MSKEKENGGTRDGSTHLLAEEEGQERPSNSGDTGGDPAEKLVSQDGKLNSNTEASEVKFISADSQNGDAKIDIETVKVAFAGMGKEELMKFANDPYWIRMRWALFALFWLLWLGMLLGAVAIIVFAPKCAAPAPLKWWEQAPLYEVKLSSSEDAVHDLEDLQSKLDDIANLGIKGVVLSSIFQTSNDTFDDYTDFNNVNPLFGTIDDVKNLTAAMKNKGLHLILDFVPNYTSKKHPWFIKSVNKEGPFKDYYVWAQPKDNSVPNNWRSLFGKPAWTWNPNRSEYYLHQFESDQPDLNFRSPHVKEEFKSIFKFWIDLGVSGFQLSRVEFLLEDKELKSEDISDKVNATLGDYDFFTHVHTANLPELFDVLTEMREAVHSFTDGDGVLAVTSNVTKYGPLHRPENPTDGMNVSMVNVSKYNVSADIVRNVDIFSSLNIDFTANDLSNAISKWEKTDQNTTRLFWELGSIRRYRSASNLSPLLVDGLNAVLMLLPGTPVVRYGDELDASGNQHDLTLGDSSASDASKHEVHNHSPSKNLEDKNEETKKSNAERVSKLYKKLTELRNSPSVMYGFYESTVFNDTVFAYTRWKSGSPGYLVAFNPSDAVISASFNNLKHMSDEMLKTEAHSSNFNPKEKNYANAILLPPKSVIVLSFVPKLD